MTRSRFLQRHATRAFTIVEMLVSTAILGLLMVLLLSTVDQTQRVWSRTSNKLSQFQAARTAFEAMTRNLSQATLNTYYATDWDKNGNPLLYKRESDLHFVSGRAAQPKLLGDDEKIYPTHAVFFQAPIGWTSEMEGKGDSDVKRYRALNSLLSSVGYYIKWGEDETVPAFIRNQSGLMPERFRFRLMEVIQPAESLSIYLDPEVFNATIYQKSTDWIQVALGRMKRANGRGAENASRVLAENIVALVLLPKLAEEDRRSPDALDLAPGYEYDSLPSRDGVMKKDTGTNNFTKGQWINLEEWEKKQLHQLPPIMQVTMVAIDETSAIRQQDIGGETPPEWTTGLFKSITREEDYRGDIGDGTAPDPSSLLGRLQKPTNPALRMNYRVYTADVVIRGAKWSTDKQ
jgi:uncharacterized protein (TIGR02599 family)